MRNQNQFAAREDPEMLSRARRIFDTLRKLGEAFDPAYADLFSENAKIVNTRYFPEGEARTIQLSGSQYKPIIRASMPVAEMQSDRSFFSAATYTIEGNSVRILCNRFSQRKSYNSPYALLVGPDEDGEWRILEEVSESQP